MKIINSQSEYGLLAKLFHWVTFIVLIAQVPFGFYLVGLEFSDERIDINCEEKAIFMFLTVTQSLRNLHYRYRPACKLFSFQLATNLRSKKALITSLN